MDSKRPFDPDNDNEVAEWFTHHDVTELSTEPVKVMVKKRKRESDSVPSESLTIRIAPEDMEELKKMAEENGIGHTTMARIILHRGIRKTPKAGTQ